MSGENERGWSVSGQRDKVRWGRERGRRGEKRESVSGETENGERVNG